MKGNLIALTLATIILAATILTSIQTPAPIQKPEKEQLHTLAHQGQKQPINTFGRIKTEMRIYVNGKLVKAEDPAGMYLYVYLGFPFIPKTTRLPTGEYTMGCSYETYNNFQCCYKVTYPFLGDKHVIVLSSSGCTATSIPDVLQEQQIVFTVTSSAISATATLTANSNYTVGCIAIAVKHEQVLARMASYYSGTYFTNGELKITKYVPLAYVNVSLSLNEGDNVTVHLSVSLDENITQNLINIYNTFFTILDCLDAGDTVSLTDVGGNVFSVRIVEAYYPDGRSCSINFLGGILPVADVSTYWVYCYVSNETSSTWYGLPQYYEIVYPTVTITKKFMVVTCTYKGDLTLVREIGIIRKVGKAAGGGGTYHDVILWKRQFTTPITIGANESLVFGIKIS